MMCCTGWPDLQPDPNVRDVLRLTKDNDNDHGQGGMGGLTGGGTKDRKGGKGDGGDLSGARLTTQ